MLNLTQAQQQEIATHGESGYPDEVCGFLIGTASGEDKTVTRLKAIENSWDDSGTPEFAGTGGDDFATASRRRRFTIPPDEYYAADKEARERGEAILGFYHTHPDHPARPSQYDLALAREIFPGYSYIILSVHDGKADEMTSHVLRDDYSDFYQETILIGD